ncbi:MAG: J domain-containing protein [Verrucomicrobia bacterium]|nr:J domain-containing protein [Verrucomicrobiota bacterium]
MANSLSILHTTPTYTPFKSAFEILEKPLRYCHDRMEPQDDLTPPSNTDCFMYLGGMVAYPFVFCAAPLTMAADVIMGVVESAFCICRGFKLKDVAELAKKKILVSPIHHLTFLSSSLGLPSIIMLTISLPLPDLSPKRQFLFSCATLFGMGLLFFSHPLVDEKSQATALNNLPKRVREIVHRKEVFTVTNVALAALAYFRFSFIPFFTQKDIALIGVKYILPLLALHWKLYYTLSQRLIGSFSPSFNHQIFSIFKEGGARDKKDPLHRSYQDLRFSGVSLEDWDAKAERFYEQYRSSYTSKKTRRSVPHQGNIWQVFLNDEYIKIKSSINQEDAVYKEFKTRILGGKLPLELLGLSPIFTEQDIIKAFRKYRRVLHPDKNASPEAVALFKCLCEARYLLDPQSRPVIIPDESKNR